MDGCIRRVRSARSRQATTSHSRPGPDLFWTTLMMQPLVLLARECQLSHWDPVRQRPHLRPHASAQSCPSWDKFRYTAFGCAAPHPSLSPHRIKPSAAPSDILLENHVLAALRDLAQRAERGLKTFCLGEGKTKVDEKKLKSQV